MKFSSQEEYGLRCLLQLGRGGRGSSKTIAEISEAEGLSQAYVAKLLRILRISGFVDSVRGQEGGYTLARDAEELPLSEVLAGVGGRFHWTALASGSGGDRQRAGTHDAARSH